jgi:hypothetical protein
MSLDLEPPHRHRGGGLPIWLEWITAISALVVSVCSIAIAIHNGQIENKMLKANSFPYLYGGISDATPEGREQISIDFVNNGVGPANQKSLKVKVGDRYVTSVKDLIRTVFPQDVDKATEVLKEIHNRVPTRFVAAKGDQFVFRIAKTPQNARYWDTLDQSYKSSWSVEYCYCSVFEECWRVKSDDRALVDDRKPVKECKRDEPHEFIP